MTITRHAPLLSATCLMMIGIVGCGGDSQEATVRTVTQTATATSPQPPDAAPSTSDVPAALVDRAQNQLDDLIAREAGLARRVSTRTLVPAGDGIDAVGRVALLEQGEDAAIALSAVGLAPSNGYAFWVRDAATNRTRLLGFAPPVKDDGRLLGIAPFPRDPSEIDGILLSEERDDRPSSPTRELLVVAPD